VGDPRTGSPPLAPPPAQGFGPSQPSRCGFCHMDPSNHLSRDCPQNPDNRPGVSIAPPGLTPSYGAPAPDPAPSPVAGFFGHLTSPALNRPSGGPSFSPYSAPIARPYHAGGFSSGSEERDRSPVSVEAASGAATPPVSGREGRSFSPPRPPRLEPLETYAELAKFAVARRALAQTRGRTSPDPERAAGPPPAEPQGSPPCPKCQSSVILCPRGAGYICCDTRRCDFAWTPGTPDYWSPAAILACGVSPANAEAFRTSPRISLGGPISLGHQRPCARCTTSTRNYVCAGCGMTLCSPCINAGLEKKAGICDPSPTGDCLCPITYLTQVLGGAGTFSPLSDPIRLATPRALTCLACGDIPPAPPCPSCGWAFCESCMQGETAIATFPTTSGSSCRPGWNRTTPRPQ
jgi:hypothetical protein